MAGHKKQHFIPSSYLKAWCDPKTPEGQEPYVWVFPRDGSNPFRRAPHKLFRETELYTIALPGGGRNLVLEHGLSQLENKFVAIRDRTKSQHPLDFEDRAWLCAFIAAAHARTPAQRDHQKQQWGKVRDMADKIQQWAENATPEQRAKVPPRPKNDGPSLTYEDVKTLADKPLQAMMAPAIQVATELLIPLDLVVFSCPDPTSGFITSDNPCVWFDPEAYKRPPMYQAPGLVYESIEISLPVSPRQIVVLNRRGLNGYHPAPGRLVDEFNRRTRFNCVDYFVNNTNAIQAVWFDSGVEPEDSWRKHHSDPPRGD